MDGGIFKYLTPYEEIRLPDKLDADDMYIIFRVEYEDETFKDVYIDLLRDCYHPLGHERFTPDEKDDFLFFISHQDVVEYILKQFNYPIEQYIGHDFSNLAVYENGYRMIHKQVRAYINNHSDEGYQERCLAGRITIDGTVYDVAIYGGEIDTPHFHLESRKNAEEYCIQLYKPVPLLYHTGRGIINTINKFTDSFCKQMIEGLSNKPTGLYGERYETIWSVCSDVYPNLIDWKGNENVVESTSEEIPDYVTFAKFLKENNL